MVRISIIVKTNAKTNHINFDPELKKYKVEVKSKPINNQANKEILKFLKKYFKAERVEIISGFQNRNKLIELVNPQTLIECHSTE